MVAGKSNFRLTMPPGKARPTPPEICPVCGEEVPRNALACPECGADHQSGWREDAQDRLDLPEADFDYDDFVEREFGSGSKRNRLHPVWWITALVLLIAMLWLLTR